MQKDIGNSGKKVPKTDFFWRVSVRSDPSINVGHKNIRRQAIMALQLAKLLQSCSQ
jgi:hypothetical protein